MITKDGKCTDPDFLFFLTMFLNDDGEPCSVCDNRCNSTIGKILTYRSLPYNANIVAFFKNKPPIILETIGMYKSKKQEKKEITLAIKQERSLNRTKKG